MGMVSPGSTNLLASIDQMAMQMMPEAYGYTRLPNGQLVSQQQLAMIEAQKQAAQQAAVAQQIIMLGGQAGLSQDQINTLLATSQQIMAANAAASPANTGSTNLTGAATGSLPGALGAIPGVSTASQGVTPQTMGGLPANAMADQSRVATNVKDALSFTPEQLEEMKKAGINPESLPVGASISTGLQFLSPSVGGTGTALNPFENSQPLYDPGDIASLKSLAFMPPALANTPTAALLQNVAGSIDQVLPPFQTLGELQAAEAQIKLANADAAGEAAPVSSDAAATDETASA